MVLFVFQFRNRLLQNGIVRPRHGTHPKMWFCVRALQLSMVVVYLPAVSPSPSDQNGYSHVGASVPGFRSALILPSRFR